MMQLKLSDVQELAHLQTRLACIDQEITDLVGDAHQLAEDHCSCNIILSMLNETRQAVEHQKRQAEEAMMDPVQKHYHLYGVMVGYRVERPQSTERSYKFSEADALLFLNMIINKRKRERMEIISRLRSITKNSMAAIIFLDEENPVHNHK